MIPGVPPSRLATQPMCKLLQPDPRIAYHTGVFVTFRHRLEAPRGSGYLDYNGVLRD